MRMNPKATLGKNVWVAAGFVILGLLAAYAIVSGQARPKMKRQVGAGSDSLQSLWVANAYYWLLYGTTDASTVYAYSGGEGEKLLAFDGLTGSILWQRDLQVHDEGEQGVFYLLVSADKVFTVTPTTLNAYSTGSGDRLWARQLGGGHVSIHVQMEGPALRVYYGSEILEVSRASGEILARQPLGNTIWIEGNVDIDRTSTDPMRRSGVSAFDRATRRALWETSGPPFSVVYPYALASGIILVNTNDSRLCALVADTGTYVWCRQQDAVSNVALDATGSWAYLLRDDFTLARLDLSNGEIVAQTQFLPKELPEYIRHGLGGGYSVALVKDGVVVSFGDSNQTFGLGFRP